MHYCLFLDGALHGNDRKIITKSGEILGKRLDVHTTGLSPANLAGYRAHQGGKFLFGEEQSYDHPICLSAMKNQALRDLAIKTVPGYLRLKSPAKRAISVALACIYGLEGKVQAKFIVTNINADLIAKTTWNGYTKTSGYTDTKPDINPASRLAVKMSCLLGVRIFNITERKDVVLLTGLLKKLK